MDESGSTNSPRSQKKLSKKLTFLLIGLLLVIGAVLGWLIYPNFLKHKEPTAKTSVSSEKPKIKQPTTLIYAYKEGKQTTVRQLTLKNNVKKDLFNFEETFDYSSGDSFYAGLNPAIDISHDSKTYTYAAKDGLWLRPVGQDDKNQLIKATVKSTSLMGNNYTFEPAFKPAPNSPVAAGLFNPVWSLDDKSIGFEVSHYEGGSANAISIKTKTYANPEDIFRYATNKGLGDKFTLNDKNKSLLTAGVFPQYLVAETVPYASVYNPKKDAFYAILCPPDKQGSGDSRYVDGASSGQNGDCGEAEDRTAVKVNLTDGSYTELGKGQFANDQVMGQDGKLYIAMREAGGYQVVVLDPKDKTKDEVKVVAIAKLPSDGKVLATRVFGYANPIAVIYYSQGEKYYASVVDIQKKSHVGTFEIAKVSAFKPLLLK